MFTSVLSTGNTQKRQDGQYTYKRNTGAHLCNHSCRGKAISIVYYMCVFVAFGTQLTMRMCQIVVRGLPGSEIFIIRKMY